MALRERTRTKLLEGKLLWLGDTTTGLDRPDLVRDRFPLTVAHAVLDGSYAPERFAHEPLSCLIGPGDRIAAFVEGARQARGEEDVRRLWPDLAFILCTRDGMATPPVRPLADDRVVVVDLLTRPEAPLAVEDLRHGAMRLLVEHGVYFEFVPLGLADDLNPPRLGVEEVEAGTPYEVALTSPAGLWAERSGLVVCFDSVGPPLVRVLATSRPAPVRADEPAALPRQAPHRQAAGSPAARPGTPGHIPWSAPADRG
jgi:hypothetical protein